MAFVYDRTERLIGKDGLLRLQQAHVAVVGIGGVGSYTVEALARTGVGTLTLIDHDCVDITNINRQIHALHSTVGQPKVKAMADRIRDINPEIRVIAKQEFVTEATISQLLPEKYDFLVDAIDTVSSKVRLVLYAKERGIPVVCSMGTANKLDATRFALTDISKTHTCPLARVMRKSLKDHGIAEGVTVLYSTAPALPVETKADDAAGRKPVVASISYVPATAGLMIAGHVIQELLKND